MVQNGYGGPEVLGFRELPDPVAHDGEVLVRVHAAGVDPGVRHLMTGTPLAARLAFGVRPPRDRIPGFDFAGTVVDGTAGDDRFSPGDAVFGTSTRAFADYVVARPALLATKPAHVGFGEAAAVPTSGMTALQAVRGAGRVREGDRVLILGAGGGVGSFAVQVAKEAGAHVTAVCGTRNLARMATLGADTVLDYSRQDVRGSVSDMDLVLAVAGDWSLASLRRLLAPRGTLVLVGGEGGGPLLGALSRGITAAALSPFTRQRLLPFFSSPRAADLQALRGMLDEGTLTPTIDRRFPLSRAGEALAYIGEGHTRGKSVLTLVDE
ncbi:NAD(P)-dependent alcohol dehydrogenase [Herbiconiux sp. L3-i23]|uniref:NAD(P)-dependent alcohol dehydrogenase n=1 Tax=Herbiconiux sp. L3-i23 TaxID=2905871 RepID=UPI002070501D|nr:NAD(P)-dependent alcohol dehydrogenase [Herbiconiux sp. L3-i23]BDI23522.1 NADPH:quinone reductase [Herbiconiux sp. L3-i23]